MSWFDDNAPTGSGTPTMSGGPTASMPGPGQPTGGSGGAAPGSLAWVQQQLAGVQSTDDPNYWVGVMAKDPKVAAGDPSAIQYWQQRMAQGDGALAVRTGQVQPANGGGASGAPGGIPGMDPGYNFRFDQGVRALQASAASKGTLLTGGTLKALADFGQGLASQEYQNAFGRQYALANLGLQANQDIANAGSGFAGNASNTLTNNANAQGASGIAQGNIWGNAVNNLGQLGSLYTLQNSYGGPSGGGTLPSTQTVPNSTTFMPGY